MGKACRECGKTFTGSKPGQAGNAEVYCSDDCRLPERECPSCLQTFRPKSLAKRTQTYCSYKCGVLGRKPASPRGSAYSRWRRYGITPDEQALMLKHQNNICRICEEPAAHVDHDAGGVRGFLCAKCNLGLGHFRDRPDLLEGAVDYLRSTSKIVGGMFRITDNVRIEVRDPVGNLKDQREFANLVTTVGKGLIADRLLAAPSVGVPTHMAIGTGTSGPAAGDTALGTEIDRNALTSKTRSGAVVTMVGDWAAGDGTNAAITEAGIFDASSSGNLYARVVFGAIAKAAGDTLSISWTITIS